MAAPKVVVQGTQAAPPRVGLIVSAATPSGEGSRWQGGITYDPETGQPGYRTDLCDPGENDRDLPARPEVVAWDAYAIGDGIRCTALAANRTDWRAQARRQLEAVAEYQLSAELWSGTLATAHGYDNLFLDNGDAHDVVTSGADVGPRDALAFLEQYLADAARGQRGMIHAPRAIVSTWAQDGGLRREGGLILTTHDTIVVPGAGYPLDSGKAFATGMVEVRRGDVEITGDPLSSAEVDRDTNTVEVRAEQVALASWDGVAHGAVNVDIDGAYDAP